MADLWIGIAIMVGLSLALLALGMWLGSKLPRDGQLLACFGVVTLIAVSALVMRDDVRITWLLPFTNVPILGNPTPALTALLAGLAWATIRGALWRKMLVMVPLVVVGFYGAWFPLFASPPALRNVWRGPVAMQTSRSSCSPAAAASLLRAYGVQTSEGEMAELCLTREAGTSMLGLYRGLKLKGAERGLEPRGFVRTIPELREQMRGPVLLSVALMGDDPPLRFQRQSGWIVNVPHTVVLYGFLSDQWVVVGDPAVGKDVWHVSDLATLWKGEGVEVVPREGPNVER